MKKQRYWLYRRGGIYYIHDSQTGVRESLQTRNKQEAEQIRTTRNMTSARPVIGMPLAKACLTSQDPKLLARTCARQFPDAKADYQKNQPATEMQKEKLRFFGCTWNGDITVRKASEALGECERQFPGREAMGQLQKRKWVKIPGTFPVKEFDQLDKTSSQEVTIQKTEIVASKLAMKREDFYPAKSDASDEEPAPPSYLEYQPEPRPDSFLTSGIFQNAHASWCDDV